jgi:hypothetical protein
MTAALGAGLTAVLVEHVAWSVPLVVGHRPSSQRRTGPGSTRCRQWVGCYHWRDGYPSDVRRPQSAGLPDDLPTVFHPRRLVVQHRRWNCRRSYCSATDADVTVKREIAHKAPRPMDEG